jgi:hypothetical protein
MAYGEGYPAESVTVHIRERYFHREFDYACMPGKENYGANVNRIAMMVIIIIGAQFVFYDQKRFLPGS